MIAYSLGTISLPKENKSKSSNGSLGAGPQLLGGSRETPSQDREHLEQPRHRQGGECLRAFKGRRCAVPHSLFSSPPGAHAMAVPPQTAGSVRSTRTDGPPWYFVRVLLWVLRALVGNASVTSSPVPPRNQRAGGPGPEGPVWCRGRTEPRVKLPSCGRRSPSCPSPSPRYRVGSSGRFAKLLGRWRDER